MLVTWLSRIVPHQALTDLLMRNPHVDQLAVEVTIHGSIGVTLGVCQRDFSLGRGHTHLEEIVLRSLMLLGRDNHSLTNLRSYIMYVPVFPHWKPFRLFPRCWRLPSCCECPPCSSPLDALWGCWFRSLSWPLRVDTSSQRAFTDWATSLTFMVSCCDVSGTNAPISIGTSWRWGTSAKDKAREVLVAAVMASSSVVGFP